jgi:CheY-like chemotaxis protein
MKYKVIADKKQTQLSVRPTIMIVDDNIKVATSFQRYLTISGYSVIVAHSVAEARMMLEACKDAESRPKIIITDYHMGDQTGSDLLNWMHNSETGKDIKTILMSGAANKGEISQARADIFLQKPVVIGDLISAMFELVPHKINLADVLRLSPGATQIHNKSIFNEMKESQRVFSDKIRHDLGNYLQPLGNFDLLANKEFVSTEEVLQEVKDSLCMIKETNEKLRTIFKKIISSEPVIEGDFYRRLKVNETARNAAIKIISDVQEEADNTSVIKFLDVFISEMDRLNSEFSKIVSQQEEGWIDKGIALRIKMFELLKTWFPVIY